MEYGIKSDLLFEVNSPPKQYAPELGAASQEVYDLGVGCPTITLPVTLLPMTYRHVGAGSDGSSFHTDWTL